MQFDWKRLYSKYNLHSLFSMISLQTYGHVFEDNGILEKCAENLRIYKLYLCLGVELRSVSAEWLHDCNNDESGWDDLTSTSSAGAADYVDKQVKSLRANLALFG